MFWIYAIVYAGLLRAGVAALAGENDRALEHLRNAGDIADEHKMALHAAAARWRHGSLLGGREGDALKARAEEWMRQSGIVDVARMVQVYAPGFAGSLET